MALEWTPAMSVGVREIDDQHKQLFASAKRLLDAMLQGKGRYEIHSIVQFLEKYVVEHFATEEKLMDQYRYPSSLSHKTQHKLFTSDLVRNKTKLEDGGADSATAIQIMQEISDWLVNHIGKTDKALGDFLSQKMH